METPTPQEPASDDADRADSPAAFDRHVEAAGPASLLVVITGRMGEFLRHRMAPDDVWQEVLLHAWRDRRRFQPQGPGSFRRWLLKIIDHRIHDLVDREGAIKRGAGGMADAGAAIDESPPLLTSTTPSRVASAREEAELMQMALKELPEELREILHPRLFEGLEMNEIAVSLRLGVEAVRHRFRKGAEIYHGRLRELLMNRRSGRATGGR